MQAEYLFVNEDNKGVIAGSLKFVRLARTAVELFSNVELSVILTHDICPKAIAVS